MPDSAIDFFLKVAVFMALTGLAIAMGLGLLLGLLLT